MAESNRKCLEKDHPAKGQECSTEPSRKRSLRGSSFREKCGPQNKRANKKRGGIDDEELELRDKVEELESDGRKLRLRVKARTLREENTALEANLVRPGWNGDKSPTSRTGTSVKYRHFVREPMGVKSVEVLPGIGKETAATLAERNKITKAFQLVGVFLMMGKDEAKFKEYMREAGAHANHQHMCYLAMKEYCGQFM